MLALLKQAVNAQLSLKFNIFQYVTRTLKGHLFIAESKYGSNG